MLGQCLASVADGDPAFTKNCFNVSCFILARAAICDVIFYELGYTFERKLLSDSRIMLIKAVGGDPKKCLNKQHYYCVGFRVVYSVCSAFSPSVTPDRKCWTRNE